MIKHLSEFIRYIFLRNHRIIIQLAKDKIPHGNYTIMISTFKRQGKMCILNVDQEPYFLP